jgi:hypothetical protein
VDQVAALSLLAKCLRVIIICTRRCRRRDKSATQPAAPDARRAGARTHAASNLILFAKIGCRRRRLWGNKKFKRGITHDKNVINPGVCGIESLALPENGVPIDCWLQDERECCRRRSFGGARPTPEKRKINERKSEKCRPPSGGLEIGMRPGAGGGACRFMAPLALVQCVCSASLEITHPPVNSINVFLIIHVRVQNGSSQFGQAPHPRKYCAAP